MLSVPSSYYKVSGLDLGGGPGAPGPGPHHVGGPQFHRQGQKKSNPDPFCNPVATAFQCHRKGQRL